MISKSIFNPYDDKVNEDGANQFATLAKNCPVYHYNGRFNFFVANCPTDVTNKILKDTSTWTIENGSSPKQLPAEQRTALMLDNQYHNKIRFIMQRGFATNELKRLSLVVHRIADELIDKMLAMPEQRGDFFELFIMPLPARLMCIMLGAEEKDFMIYKEWADEYFYSILNEPDTEMSLEAIHTVSAPFFAMMAERRDLLIKKGLEPDLSLLGTVLPNDFLSRFMCDKIDGKYLDDNEILSLMLGIIVGGNETTMNLIGNLLARLLENRELWERLRADPSLAELAIEESLRIDPPVIGLFRSARHQTELSGCPIPKDAKVMYNIASANRNPEIWDDPDEFRLDRPIGQVRKHVAFAGGIHSCIGAPLVRMEAKVVLEKLLTRMPNLTIAGTSEAAAGFNVHGKSRMPLSWG